MYTMQHFNAYSMYVPKVLEQKTRLDAEILLCLDVSGHLIFCTQTHACGCMHADHAHKRRCTHTDKHRHMQNSSATFHVQACYMFRPGVSLSTNPCPMLVAFQDPEIQLTLDRLFPKCRPSNYSAQN